MPKQLKIDIPQEWAYLIPVITKALARENVIPSSAGNHPEGIDPLRKRYQYFYEQGDEEIVSKQPPRTKPSKGTKIGL